MMGSRSRGAHPAGPWRHRGNHRTVAGPHRASAAPRVSPLRLPPHPAVRARRPCRSRQHEVHRLRHAVQALGPSRL